MQYLKSLLEAIHIDKINVIGYTAWSLLDNFQWDGGYSYLFGLHRVDFNDPKRPRTAKMSVKFLQEVIRTRRVPETDPEFPDDEETTAAGSGTTASAMSTADSRTVAPTATSSPSGAASPAGAKYAGILTAAVAGIIQKTWFAV